ncbi:hypothetical protein SRHO_G00034600 [Serrasalmus rhombeus]
MQAGVSADVREPPELSARLSEELGDLLELRTNVTSSLLRPLNNQTSIISYTADAAAGGVQYLAYFTKSRNKLAKLANYRFSLIVVAYDMPCLRFLNVHTQVEDRLLERPAAPLQDGRNGRFGPSAGLGLSSFSILRYLSLRRATTQQPTNVWLCMIITQRTANGLL